jgi:hypothetical protein
LLFIKYKFNTREKNWRFKKKISITRQLLLCFIILKFCSYFRYTKCQTLVMHALIIISSSSLDFETDKWKKELPYQGLVLFSMNPYRNNDIYIKLFKAPKIKIQMNEILIISTDLEYDIGWIRIVKSKNTREIFLAPNCDKYKFCVYLERTPASLNSVMLVLNKGHAVPTIWQFNHVFVV